MANIFDQITDFLGNAGDVIGKVNDVVDKVKGQQSPATNQLPTSGTDNAKQSLPVTAETPATQNQLPAAQPAWLLPVMIGGGVLLIVALIR